MADVKWIKITTSIFDDEKIKVIDSMPERDAIFVIWIKLLTLAGKCNGGGLVYLSETVPYTDEMLAAIFNRPLNVVRLALDIFRKFGMIDIFQDQKILIINWERHQNIAGLEKIRIDTAARVSKYRERKRLETCNVTVTKCNDTELESDRDIDKEEDLRVRGAHKAPPSDNPEPGEPVQPSPTSSKRFIKPILEDVRAYCTERGNTVSPEKFLDYYESNGWKVGRNPMKDWKAAVRTWERNGLDKEQPKDTINGYKAKDSECPVCKGKIVGTLTTCMKCGYTKGDNIKDPENQAFYKVNLERSRVKA